MRMMVTQLMGEENQKRVQGKLQKMDMDQIDKILSALDVERVRSIIPSASSLQFFFLSYM